MEIMQVMGRLVCTQRVEGLGHMNLRILRNNKGKKLVAVDPVEAFLEVGKVAPAHILAVGVAELRSLSSWEI